ncbi:hypothetical protein AVEN_173703-1 [Araneus ventricosus]|uniref:Uncharacterized protein n=1 Tax=Araneus ventricosus TaxID=182803 RepID=A0A4Y2PET4_ARAVE|nr:hypothetical protein AVEN_173703-1 [Araneus ventricosus]
MRLGLPSNAVVGDRCGVSDRAVVVIASSFLHDVGLITSNNSDLVVTKEGCEGKGAFTMETLPVPTSEIIDGELPTTDRRDLSKDQMYLLEISQALRLGNCSDELVEVLVHYQFTLADNSYRVLRLY